VAYFCFISGLSRRSNSLNSTSTLCGFCAFLWQPPRLSGIKRLKREEKPMMNFIWWLIVGLIAGALARLIMPGRDPMGLIATIVLGIVGSLLGGLVSMAIWRNNTDGFQPAGLLFSILGAIIVLWIWRTIKSRNTTV
jgi:uncharacterized membrane protein YeaQ/YmgE (transglycosylase-associated protein family)